MEEGIDVRLVPMKADVLFFHEKFLSQNLAQNNN